MLLFIEGIVLFFDKNLEIYKKTDPCGLLRGVKRGGIKEGKRREGLYREG